MPIDYPKRYDEFDVVVTSIFKRARERGFVIPCKRGCDACCYDVLTPTHLEAVPIVERLRQATPEERLHVKRNIVEWFARMLAIGIEPTNPFVDVRQYNAAHAACPLLDREKRECTMYDVRPIACRAHHIVNSEPSACANREREPAVYQLHLEEPVMAPFLRMLAADVKGGSGSFDISIAFFPVLLASMWPLVEDPSMSVDAWLSDVQKTGVRFEPTAFFPIERAKSLCLALYCPGCGKRHIDEGEWALREHHTHRCVDDAAGKGCGHEWRIEGTVFFGAPLAEGYPPDWPRCTSCGDYALDGKATCGRTECVAKSFQTFGDRARGRIEGTCVRCGKTRHEDGSAVTWKCRTCDNFVCRSCTKLIDGSDPPEYHEMTLCSRECWEKAGSPDD